MHKRAISCNLCGKAFFPASMKFHEPQCRRKQAHIPVPCQHCDVEFPQGEMSSHLKSCRLAKAARRRRAKQQQQSTSSLPEITESTRGTGQTLRDRRRQRSGPISTAAAVDATFGPTDGGRVNCAVCGRGFVRDRIAIHQRICRQNKTTKKRRGKFDSTRQRLEGTDMGGGGGGFSGSGGSFSGSSTRSLKRQSGKKAPLKAGKWKRQSNALRAAMRNAKMVTKIQKNGGDFSVLPPPPPAEEPVDFIPCPHCGRTFSAQAGERHIAACARTINKPRMLLRGGQRSNPGSTRARSRKTGGPSSSFGSGRVPMKGTRSKRPNWDGGSTHMSGSSRMGGRSGGMGSGGSGGSGMGGGGFSTSTATSANNPLVTNHRQTYDKARFR